MEALELPADEAEPFDFHALPSRDTAWTEKALCASEYARTRIDYWYLPDTEGSAHGNAARSVVDLLHTDRQRIQIGKRICGRCPVRHDCLEDALSRNERDGVWGGLTTEERDLLISLPKEVA